MKLYDMQNQLIKKYAIPVLFTLGSSGYCIGQRIPFVEDSDIVFFDGDIKLNGESSSNSRVDANEAEKPTLYAATASITSNSEISGEREIIYKAGEKVVLDSTFSFRPTSENAYFEARVADVSEIEERVANNSEGEGNGIAEELTSLSNLQITVSPNPMTSEATVKFQLESRATVQIVLHDATGQQVIEIVPSQELEEGTHSFDVIRGDLPTGLYYCVLSFGKGTPHYTKVIVQ